MQFDKLVKKYNTPLYVYDFDFFSDQYEKLKTAFKARKSIIAYAIKANSNLSVIKHFASLGSGADCVSIGEVKRAFLAGIDKYKIIFSGVGKKDEEIKEALQRDILMINIESAAELLRVEKIAKTLGKISRISIRVNPNIDPKTHPYISTGLHENKFGVDIESAKKMYIYAKKSKNLNPIGIHFHIGSQLTKLEPIKEASKIVADLVKSLKAINIDIRFFDVGGGLGIKYKDETLIKPYDYAQAILDTLSGLDVSVICEPGRFLVGNGGYFITKVLYEKINGDKRFVIVDGAMNDLIRPSLYKVYHKVEALSSVKNPKISKANIVGPICESGDFFAKSIEFPETNPGDLVVIHSAGAYGFSMSSNYNTRPRAAEIALSDGKENIIRRRETFEDLIACEIDYLI